MVLQSMIHVRQNNKLYGGSYMQKKNLAGRCVALGLVSVMALSSATACGKKSNSKKGGIKHFTMFTAMTGTEINDDNDIKKIIAEKTGADCKESWLAGQTDAEAVNSMISSGTFTDFVNGGDSMKALVDAGALVAWDEYLESGKYPNLEAMYTKAEWDKFRQEDGKIYWANVFQNHKGDSTDVIHNDEAFWVQVRVLEDAGYPEITTLDEYFDLLEKYYDKNKKNEDGTDIIPYTMLCEDWRYFCIENAPEFLDGYPNDGSVMVEYDRDKYKSGEANPKILDYNTTDTAKKYFKKLNEEYNKGYIDKEFGTQTYDEYKQKLSTGRVLGMCDQWWDFANDVNNALKTTGLDKKGFNYVPLGLTLEKGQEQRWHAYGDTVNNSSGIAVTTACSDIDAAFKWMNDLLDQEILDLRNWGVKDVDYKVYEDDADGHVKGEYYRTEEMRQQLADTEYQAKHMCPYGYFPQWGGTSDDGINACLPTEQPGEFMASLAEPLRKCFEKYGAKGYPDMIKSVGWDKTGDEQVKVAENAFWYPMYSHSNNMNSETPGGDAWGKMGSVKHEWLPKVVVAKDFESEWDKYQSKYKACKPEDFIAEMQAEIDKRYESYLKIPENER